MIFAFPLDYFALYSMQRIHDSNQSRLIPFLKKATLLSNQTGNNLTNLPFNHDENRLVIQINKSVSEYLTSNFVIKKFLFR